MAALALAATFVLILWGGIVHVTESSLACPDWPLCYGQLMPEMKGKIAIEHGHRMLASSVGLLAILLAIQCFRLKPADGTLRRLSLGAVTLVIAQGLLGGLTVIYKLPTLVSTAHLATSMLFLLAIFTIWLRLGDWRAPTAGDGTAALALSNTLVYAQMVLGAFVRHTGSALACNTTILLCNGELFPTQAGPALLHLTHRVGGLLVALSVTAVAILFGRTAAAAGRMRLARLAAVGPVLVLAQIAVGIWTVKSGVGLVPVTLHLGLAALILAQQYSLLWLGRREPRWMSSSTADLSVPAFEVGA